MRRCAEADARRLWPVRASRRGKRRGAGRARQGYVTARTATTNRIRGLLAGVGIVLPPIKAMALHGSAACSYSAPAPKNARMAWAMLTGDQTFKLPGCDPP